MSDAVAERVLEHELDVETDVSTDLPAMLDEHQRNLLQIQQVFEYTVEPGVMKLPVKSVSTTEDSETWSIVLDHPVTGDIQKHVEKPVRGWHDEHELVELLGWYHVDENDVYQLQCEYIYVEYDESAYNDWKLVPPPWAVPEPPLRDKIANTLGVKRPEQTMLTMWTTMFLGTGLLTLLGVWFAAGLAMGAVASAIVLGAMIVATVLGVMILDAKGDV